MKLSRYIKVYPFKDKPGYVLLFSTLNASKLLVKRETVEAVESGVLGEPEHALLAKYGMIVPDREEEQRSVFGLRDALNSKNPGFSIVVVLNLACNFSCTYCYEGDMKGDIHMSETTARHLVDFIKSRFAGTKRSLSIDFYGGEPLLSTGLIRDISVELKSFTEKRNASYSFTLVTNGSLFTRQVAEELVPLGLKSVKITLDGPAEIHNRYRPFKSGAGSFDVIIENIKATWDLVKIGIGGNFEKNTYQQFPFLLDYLIHQDLTPDKIGMIKFDPIMKNREGDRAPAECTGGSVSINEPWMSEAILSLREEVLRRGFSTQKLRPVFCMVESSDSYVVNVDGTLYKCPGFLGKEGFEIGNVRTGVEDHAGAYKLGNWKNDTCAECEYLPLCYGGCRYMTFVRKGNLDSLDCQKAYLDVSLERLVKQDIAFQSKKGSRSRYTR